MSGIEKVDSAKYLSGPALGILKRHYSDDWLKFTEIRGFGSSRMLRLLGLFRSFENIYSATYEDLFKTRIFSESMINDLKELRENREREEYQSFIINVCEKEPDHSNSLSCLKKREKSITPLM